MSGTRKADGAVAKVVKTDAEWAKELNDKEYHVLRKQYTEERNVGYTKTKDEGTQHRKLRHTRT